MRLLRVLAWTLLGLCAAACLVWLVADRSATGWLESQLAGLNLSRVVSAERASLPAPDTVRLRHARLFDEQSGVEVGYVETVELRIGLPGVGGLRVVRPLLLSGRGGRVLLTADGPDLVFARAIETLLDNVSAALDARAGPDAAPEPVPEPDEDAPDSRTAFLPPMEFRDIELELRLPGQPDLLIPHADAFLRLREDGIFAVDIDVGRDGGHVLLEFNDDGLMRLATRRLAISPVFALFLPDERQLLATDIAPEGLLDLQAHDFFADFPQARGVLREGTLRPPAAPFPLTQVTLPFELREGHVRIADSQVSFEGGSAVASFDYGRERFDWELHVVDADFRRSYLDLLPDGLDMSWIDADDGGNLELHLHVSEPVLAGGVRGRPVLAGSGGLLVRSLRFGPRRVEVQDMVSRFQLQDRVLVFEEASGRCASGVVSVRGSVNVETAAVDARASVFDVDIARVRHALDMEAPEESEARPVSGWLQGDVTYTGVIGDPRKGRGHGQVSVRGGNLWRVPVLDAVLGALRLTNPGADERHRLAVLFDISGRQYDIRMFKLESPFLSLVGDGKLNVDGTIEIDIVPIKVPLGYVGDLIEYIQSQVVRLELRGTPTEPTVTVVPVRVVTRNVGRFWNWLGGLFSSEPEPAGPPFDPRPVTPAEPAAAPSAAPPDAEASSVSSSDAGQQGAPAADD